jgi:hypothetical protein
MNKTVKHGILFVAFCIAAIASTFYSMDHYSDGGCDGGTCAILLIAHALPLLIVWGLLYFAFLLAIAKRKGAFVFIGLGLILNTLVMLTDFGNTDELYTEPIILYLIAFICLTLYFGGERLGIIPERKDRVLKQKATITIIWHWTLIVYLCFQLYSTAQLTYYLFTERLVRESISNFIYYNYFFCFTDIVLAVFLYKKKHWAFPVFTLLLLYSITKLIINGFQYQWSLNILSYLILKLVTIGIMISYYFLEIKPNNKYISTSKKESSSKPD